MADLINEIKNISNKEYRERLMRMATEIARGFDFLENFDRDRVVTIYGSTRIKKGQKVYETARKLGRVLAENGITVVTGGGPGIMEAANRGAYEAGGRSVGLNIFLKIEERRNSYTTENMAFNYFFARKLLLAHIAQAYVYFPGGFGTMDEFFEITTLMSTKKIEKKMPMVLVGKSYWTELIAWMKKTCITKYGTLSPDKLKIWTIVDTAEEAYELVKDIPRKIKRHESV